MEEKMEGLLRINVIRGIKLARRDALGSDPYIIVRMGKQKLKTSVVKKNVNPEWNDELTLCVTDPNLPITFHVYDEDFFLDDKMGDAEFDIKPFVQALKMHLDMHLENVPSGTIITKVKPHRENCFSEESPITWENGELVQHMFLRLRNIECGEIEVKLQWIKVPGGSKSH
ncbi:hypothetical protein ACP275_12G025600 [Erythranthe tilingii]